MRLEPVEIEELLNKGHNEIAQLAEQLKVAGQRKAKTQKDYKVALAKRIVELRVEGLKLTTGKKMSVSVTLAKDLARGDDVVADLEQKYEDASVRYDILKQKIDYMKQRKDDLRTMLVQRRKEFQSM